MGLALSGSVGFGSESQIPTRRKPFFLPSDPPAQRHGAWPIASLGRTPCRHLRNKGMYVYHGGSGEPHDDYDNTVYWCVKTMKGYGPDDEMVGRDDCNNPERTCYEPV